MLHTIVIPAIYSEMKNNLKRNQFRIIMIVVTGIIINSHGLI
jgi:hypothetical protein